MEGSRHWGKRQDGALAADTFNRLVDRCDGNPPAGTIGAYRVIYEGLPEDAQFEFLVRVAGHLALRLSKDLPDSVSRAGELMAEWFLKPR